MKYRGIEIRKNAEGYEYTSPTGLVDGTFYTVDAAKRRIDIVLDKLENRRQPQHRPVIRETMVQCDCGHHVPERQVMSASRGTSCASCFDRMSD